MREATAEIETTTGAVVHAFATGELVQVFLLTPDAIWLARADREAIERADDDGLHPAPRRVSESFTLQGITKDGKHVTTMEE